MDVHPDGMYWQMLGQYWPESRFNHTRTVLLWNKRKYEHFKTKDDNETKSFALVVRDIIVQLV